MIKIKKGGLGTGCNSCDAEHDYIYEISLSTNPNQVLCIGMCPECLKELKNKIRKIK